MDLLLKIGCSDPELIEKCSDSSQKRYFTILGAMLTLLFALTAFAFFYVFNLLPRDYSLHLIARLFLSLLLGGTIFNYYRFLFANRRLDLRYQDGIGRKDDLAELVASGIRYFFFAFLAFMIAKGLELFIYESSINQVMEKIQTGGDQELLGLLAGLNIEPEKISILKVNGILSRYLILKGLLGNYLYITSFLVIVLYLIPILTYQRIPEVNSGIYAQNEHQNDRLFIANAHLMTEQQLKKLFKTHTGKDFESYHIYYDAPFNTMKKPFSDDQIL